MKPIPHFAYGDQHDSTLPAILTPGLVLVHDADVAVSIPVLAVYPAGFEFEMDIRLRTYQPERLAAAVHPMRRPVWMTAEDIFRFAVVYADGSVATNLQADWAPRDRGMALIQTNSDAGGREADVRYYLQPLPPPGPVTFVCEWPALGIGETRADIDSQQIIDASTKAIRLWPEEGPGGSAWSIMLNRDEPEST